MKLHERDYSDFENKEVLVTYSSARLHGEIVKKVGLVVGCVFDVGISIVDAEDHDCYLFCIYGPRSTGIEFNSKNYKSIFASTMSQIRKGHVDLARMSVLVSTIFGGFSEKEPSSDNCPYNQ